MVTAIILKIRGAEPNENFTGRKFCARVNGKFIYNNKNESRERVFWKPEEWKKFIQREKVPEFGEGDYMVLVYLGYKKIKNAFRGIVEEQNLW